MSVTGNNSGINISDRLRRGRQVERDRRAGQEEKKLGILRAGMTGIMSENGDIAGTCHRKTHLRTLGLELETPDEHKLIMFELGFASEDITLQILKDSLEPGEVLLREEEIPISWQTTNGTLVTGRPDIVICAEPTHEVGSITIVKTATGQVVIPKLGLELKSVHSIWTARDVVFGGKPKMANLAQAAHYMWKLNVPYKLIYKSYSQLGQSMSDWTIRNMNLPKPGEPNSQYVDYNAKGGIKGLKQFEVVYDLSIDNKGRVCYKLESEAEWKRSIITVDDIQRYYNWVAEMGSKKELGPRPLTIDAHGEKLNYKDCQYCPIQATCDSSEKLGYDVWLTAVKQQVNERK